MADTLAWSVVSYYYVHLLRVFQLDPDSLENASTLLHEVGVSGMRLVTSVVFKGWWRGGLPSRSLQLRTPAISLAAKMCFAANGNLLVSVVCELYNDRVQELTAPSEANPALVRFQLVGLGTSV